MLLVAEKKTVEQPEPDTTMSMANDDDNTTLMSSDGASKCSGAPLVKRPWTAEEDVALTAAVQKYGAARWSMIAAQLSTGRVGKQCREVTGKTRTCPEV